MPDFLLLAQEDVARSDWFGPLTDFLLSTPGRTLACVVLASIGVFLLLPPRGRQRQFVVGSVFMTVSVLVMLLPSLSQLSSSFAFFLLEGLAVLGALGTVTSRSPVYSAIWFASALLAVGAILLLGGAQFLGLATVAVYAGAIVVTFLFVLMLAQPEGHATYDRLGWGWLPTACAAVAGTSLAGIVAAGIVGASTGQTPDTSTRLRAAVIAAITSMEDAEAVADSEIDAATLLRNVQLTTDFDGASVLQVDLRADSGLLSGGDARLAAAIRDAAGDLLMDPTRIDIGEDDILTAHHVARLGGELFGRHLISIEVVGVLLLVALVGAIAMAIHGNEIDVQRDTAAAQPTTSFESTSKELPGA